MPNPENGDRPAFPPAIPAAAGALAGALFAALAAVGVLPWYVPLAAVSCAAAALRRPQAVLCAAVFLAAAGMFHLRAALEARPDLGTRDFYAPLTVVLDDARISSIPGLSDGVRTVRAKLRSYRDPATAATAPGGDAPVLLVFPEASSVPPYGTVIEAAGIVSPLAGADGNDEFLANWKRRGAHAVVRIDRRQTTGRETGVRSFLADGRDAMLARLFDGVRDNGVRKLAAALYCGVASGIPGEVRKDFSAAGIVHIFSVSGIHVTVLALCFAWLLRALPFRVRYPLLAALVWMYVLATGAGTPAVRAGLMVTLWAILRVSLLRLRGIDVLCWTAAAVLIADPAAAAEPGAQYSFLITAALLLLAERRDRGRLPHRGEADLVPHLFAGPRRRAVWKFTERAETVVCGAATAFLAGAAVSLQTGRRNPGTGEIAANILLALLMPFFFLLFFVQLAFGACGAGSFSAPLFERSFRLLRDFAAFFAENFPDAGAVPPHWTVTLIYLAALLTLLRTRKKPLRAAAGIVLAAVALWQLARPFAMKPALLIGTSEYGRPPFAVAADPARRRAAVVNAPDSASARRAAEFLRARGIREIEVLCFSSPTGFSKAGVDALKREVAIRRIRFAPAAKRDRSAASGATAENAEKSRDLCRIAPLGNGFRLDYFDHGSKLYLGASVIETDAGYETTVEHRGKRTTRLLPWSFDREEAVYEFGK